MKNGKIIAAATAAIVGIFGIAIAVGVTVQATR